MKHMSFLHDPATKRDLLSSSAVMTTMIVAAILCSLVVTVRLIDQLDETRDDLAAAKTKNAAFVDQLAEQAERLDQMKIALSAAIALIPEETKQQIRTIRQVGPTVERVPVPVTSTPSQTPVSPTPVVRAPTPTREPQPTQSPQPTPNPQPNPVAQPQPTPVPTPAPTPVPPIRIIPLPTEVPTPAQTGPGNKPEHAPCPESNKHCG